MYMYVCKGTVCVSKYGDIHVCKCTVCVCAREGKCVCMCVSKCVYVCKCTVYACVYCFNLDREDCLGARACVSDVRACVCVRVFVCVCNYLP